MTQQTDKRNIIVPIAKGAAVVVPAAMVGMLAILNPHIDSREGLRLGSYRDSGGVWTICRGETVGVFPGQTKTKDECDMMTQLRLITVGQRVADVVKVSMSDMRWAGLTSLAYNIGNGAFDGSTLVRRLNVKDPAACDAILAWKYQQAIVGSKWDMADGRKDGKANCMLDFNKPYCGGIRIRRYDERAMCQGVYHGH